VTPEVHKSAAIEVPRKGLLETAFANGSGHRMHHYIRAITGTGVFANANDGAQKSVQ